MLLCTRAVPGVSGLHYGEELEMCVLSHLRRWKYDKPRGRGCSQIEFICNNLFPSQQQMPGNHVHAISGEQLSLSKEKSQRRLWKKKNMKKKLSGSSRCSKGGGHCEEVFFSPFLSSGLISIKAHQIVQSCK